MADDRQLFHCIEKKFLVTSTKHKVFWYNETNNRYFYCCRYYRPLSITIIFYWNHLKLRCYFCEFCSIMKIHKPIIPWLKWLFWLCLWCQYEFFAFGVLSSFSTRRHSLRGFYTWFFQNSAFVIPSPSKAAFCLAIFYGNFFDLLQLQTFSVGVDKHSSLMQNATLD